MSKPEQYPTTPSPKGLQDWRDESYKAIKSAAQNGGHHLLPILMSLGKTWTAGNLPFDPDIDHPVTVFTDLIDTREQILEYAIEAGVDSDRIKMLPVFNRWCPTAAGEHDDKELQKFDMKWSELMSALQSQLVPPSVIHERMGNAIPCQHEGKCPYSAACDFKPEEYELLIGHPVHANIESYALERITMFDEDAGDAFEYDVEPDEYTKAINVFLENYIDIDATSFDDLIRATEAEKDAWKMEILERELLVDPEIGYSQNGGRADAPLLTLGVLNGEPVETDDVTDTNLRRTTIRKIVVLYDEGKGRNDPCITVRHPPAPLRSAWSVVVMDGTPTIDVWNGRLGLDLEYDKFMTDDERAHYVRDVLGYNIVQLTDSETVFAAKAQNCSRWKFNGYLHEISEKHDRLVPTITSLQAKESIIHGKYVDNKELHLRKVRSHSELEDETLLAELGALHPGDRAIQRLAALDGYAIESNGEKGVDKSYGEIGDRYYHHMVHHEVAQAIFRVARTEDVPGADIYAYTACIPDWIPRTVVDERPVKWTDEMKATMWVLKSQESASKDRLVAETGNGERSVERHLRKLQELGAVETVEGFGGFTEYVDTGIDQVNPYGEFTIEP